MHQREDLKQSEKCTPLRPFQGRQLGKRRCTRKPDDQAARDPKPITIDTSMILELKGATPAVANCLPVVEVQRGRECTNDGALK